MSPREIAQIVAERDRYRVALDRIAYPSRVTDAAWSGARMAQIARDALAACADQKERPDA